MKNLSKTYQTEWQTITLSLETAETALSTAIDAAIETVNEITRPVLEETEEERVEGLKSERRNAAEEALEDLFGEYVEALESAIGFAENIRDEAQSYYDDRSERWQEGDAGQEYLLFIESWDEIANIDVPKLRDLIEFDDQGTLEIEHPEATDDGPIPVAQMFPGQ